MVMATTDDPDGFFGWFIRLFLLADCFATVLYLGAVEK